MKEEGARATEGHPERRERPEEEQTETETKTDNGTERLRRQVETVALAHTYLRIICI